MLKKLTTKTTSEEKGELKERMAETNKCTWECRAVCFELQGLTYDGYVQGYAEYY